MVENEVRANGLVLDLFEHGESDLIVSLFTREKGRISAIAKGARRSKKRFVNKLEPFTSLYLHLVPSRRSSLYRLDQAEIISSRPEIRFDYRRFSGASLTGELLLAWTREADPDPGLYELINWSLEQICSGNTAWTLAVYLLRLLKEIGQCPVLDACVICGEERLSHHRLSYAKHGLVCPRCDRGGEAGSTLGAGMIRAMREILAVELARTTRIGLSRNDRKAILATLINYSTWLLQKEPKSWQLVRDFL